jgi:hypothetical protein
VWVSVMARQCACAMTGWERLNARPWAQIKPPR